MGDELAGGSGCRAQQSAVQGELAALPCILCKHVASGDAATGQTLWTAGWAAPMQRRRSEQRQAGPRACGGSQLIGAPASSQSIARCARIYLTPPQRRGRAAERWRTAIGQPGERGALLRLSKQCSRCPDAAGSVERGPGAAVALPASDPVILAPPPLARIAVQTGSLLQRVGRPPGEPGRPLLSPRIGPSARTPCFAVRPP